MAKTELRLSSKISKETGMGEVLVRFFHSGIDLYSKTGVFVNPDFFEYYIDREKTERIGVSVPDKIITATRTKAEKCGYLLRASGVVKTDNRRIKTADVIYHEQQGERLETISKVIIDTFNAADIDAVKADKTWLKVVVDKFNHPERYTKKPATKATFFDLADEYLEKKQFSYYHTKGVRVLIRDVARYEGFIQATDEQRKDFTFDIDKVTKEDIEDFMDYLRNERTLAQEYPRLFRRLLKLNPVSSHRNGHQTLDVRGSNTIYKLIKKLKAIFTWLYETGKTTNRPFDGIKLGSEEVGTPYYITIDERNQIADHDFSHSKHLETQRDIFIFQCLTGCRVGDLLSLTPDNIINGILVYDPHKTKGTGTQARVPLHDKAKALVQKYEGKDRAGRLFPFISAQKYNDAIKAIFTQAGITRSVVVRNPKTGESETRPINEVASSHLARRTFIGNAYFMVKDPNIIGKMSGHVEGSRAFTRYRNIEDETLQDVINQIG